MENSLNLTPRQIVERLDQYIIGQKDAKKAVAVALEIAIAAAYLMIKCVMKLSQKTF